MPLSARFEELIGALDLKNALWHLQRTQNTKKEEITTGYQRIIDLMFNVGGCINILLKNTEKTLQDIPTKDILLKHREVMTRDSWNAQINGIDRSETDIACSLVIRDLCEQGRLGVLQKRAQALLDHEGIHEQDIQQSIGSLPPRTLNKKDILNRLRHARNKSIEGKMEVSGSPSHAEAA